MLSANPVTALVLAWGVRVSGYAELHCLSGFSFQRGASQPEELVARAAALGYSALALTDECSLAGSVRAHRAAREHGLHLIHGTEITLVEGLRIVLLATDHAGYSALCQLITRARRAAAKGSYKLTRADIEATDLSHCLCLRSMGSESIDLQGTSGTSSSQSIESDSIGSRWLAEQCPTWIAAELHRGADDARRLAELQILAAQTDLPLVAAGDVHMHVRGRRALQDTLTAIRLGCTVAEAGTQLFTNGERHLRHLADLEEVYPSVLLDETLSIAARCSFSLEQIAYCYPREVVPVGKTSAGHLRALVASGICWRWPEGASQAIRDQIERELALIAEMGYEHYFLTVHDLVAWARAQGILCQGRGSAANSVVCYCLGITEVDPARRSMLFERFISRERNEPPDIDVDFEHERREEVIQYIYNKYGRHRAALAATVICYRPRSAIRDVGKALGLALDQIDAVAKAVSGWDDLADLRARLSAQGLDPDTPALHQLAVLVDSLLGMPRHLSQHVGGFVLSDAPLHQMVPVENAAMPERTIIQWDKDDLESLGLLKVDVLALGMLSCIRRCFDLIADVRGIRHTMAAIPARDVDTYAMIQRADTVGVFQIESRAQMTMLPRLKPERFFDLVIEVAIVRPGPIQGGMVHPYLARKQGREPVSYPGPELERVLKRTLGVPIFQEQVMQIAVIAAGFTPGEADQLRRAMAAWKRKGGLEPFRQKLLAGMQARGYDQAFAERIFEQIRGFGSYGFPESHAVSFALLVYVSAWLKCHEPAAFACALLNSQPMGFYSPAQIVRDARRHGVEIRPVDVTASSRDCSLESGSRRQPALRLGLRHVKGLSRDAATRIEQARKQRPFDDVIDLVQRAHLERRDRDALTRADALIRLAGNRHAAHWAASGVERLPGLLAGHAAKEAPQSLPVPSEAAEIMADYAATGLTLRRHPLALLRPRLKRLGAMTIRGFNDCPDRTAVTVAGLVTMRQRPSTAKGTVFLMLEDETGSLNVIVRPELAAAYRSAVIHGRLLLVQGNMQRQQSVRHCVAREFRVCDRLLGQLCIRSRDFH